MKGNMSLSRPPKDRSAPGPQLETHIWPLHTSRSLFAVWEASLGYRTSWNLPIRTKDSKWILQSRWNSIQLQILQAARSYQMVFPSRFPAIHQRSTQTLLWWKSWIIAYHFESPHHFDLKRLLILGWVIIWTHFSHCHIDLSSPQSVNNGDSLDIFRPVDNAHQTTWFGFLHLLINYGFVYYL